MQVWSEGDPREKEPELTELYTESENIPVNCHLSFE